VNKKILETFEKPNLFKFGELVKNNQVDILYPDKSKLKAAVNKDIVNIDKIIDKINKVHVTELALSPAAANDILFVRDLIKIKNDLNNVNNSYKEIIENIKKIWTNPKKIEDEYRVADIIYWFYGERFAQLVSLSHEEFEQVKNVSKYIKHTLKYLSKFGCVMVRMEVYQEHPWSEEIYKIIKG